MKKFTLKHHWHLQERDPHEILPRLIDLLIRIEAMGSLSRVCEDTGMSYRHAWGLIQQGTQLFGTPLLEMERGKGSRLTPLGEKLVWAEKRVQARLAPMLEGLASEISHEIDKVIRTQSPSLRLQASHGFAVEVLYSMLQTQGQTVELKYTSSEEAVAALANNACDVAGFHVPMGDLEFDLARRYLHYFNPDKHCVMVLATRRQGLMMQTGNPLDIFALQDLTRSGVRFIHRQRGSGTRLLFEALLNAHGIEATQINDKGASEYTHAAVAAYVASGMADAGFGLEAAARRFGLDFIPLQEERYFLAMNKDHQDNPAVQALLHTMNSHAFKNEVIRIPGYDVRQTGQPMRLSEAFKHLAG